MTDERANQPPAADSDFVQQVSAKAARKLRVQKNGQQTVWFGLGMSGLIGWSVAVPTVVGAMTGLCGTTIIQERIHGHSSCWPLAVRGLRKCLALGGSGEQSHARWAGGQT